VTRAGLFRHGGLPACAETKSVTRFGGFFDSVCAGPLLHLALLMGLSGVVRGSIIVLYVF